jgi:hypothetical protein
MNGFKDIPYFVIGIIVVVLIVIFFLLVCNTRSNENYLLTGFWKADQDFCHNADINNLLIHIGPSRFASSRRPGYIVMENAHGLILNHPVEFSLSLGISLSPSITTRCYSVTIDWLDEDEPDFFPSEQVLYYYPDFGKLVFMDCHDEVTAIVYKDCNLSALIAESECQSSNTDDE